MYCLEDLYFMKDVCQVFHHQKSQKQIITIEKNAKMILTFKKKLSKICENKMEKKRQVYSVAGMLNR